MKDLGSISYFLSLEGSSSFNGYYLAQAKYASNLISKYGIIDSTIAFTPLDFHIKLTPYDGVPLSDLTWCNKLVGSLVYLTINHPDLAYVVHNVNQFMASPHFTHFIVVLHILRYDKCTLFYRHHYFASSSLVLSS